jgi:hypothetical protein
MKWALLALMHSGAVSCTHGVHDKKEDRRGRRAVKLRVEPRWHDPLLSALVREHGPDGRPDIAPELHRAPTFGATSSSRRETAVIAALKLQVHPTEAAVNRLVAGSNPTRGAKLDQGLRPPSLRPSQAENSS